MDLYKALTKRVPVSIWTLSSSLTAEAWRQSCKSVALRQEVQAPLNKGPSTARYVIEGRPISRLLCHGAAVVALLALISGCDTSSSSAISSNKKASTPESVTTGPSAAATRTSSASGGTVGATNQEDMRLETCIQRRWLHSHEEDTDSVSVYRPSDYNFPASRGRIGYEFRPEGELLYLGIAPADGTVDTNGHWAIESGNLVRIVVPSEGMSPLLLTVLSCDNDKLTVKR